MDFFTVNCVLLFKIFFLWICNHENIQSLTNCLTLPYVPLRLYWMALSRPLPLQEERPQGRRKRETRLLCRTPVPRILLVPGRVRAERERQCHHRALGGDSRSRGYWAVSRRDVIGVTVTGAWRETVLMDTCEEWKGSVWLTVWLRKCYVCDRKLWLNIKLICI